MVIKGSYFFAGLPQQGAVIEAGCNFLVWALFHETVSTNSTILSPYKLNILP